MFWEPLVGLGGVLQKKMGYTGKDPSPSLEFQEYTERKGKRRQTTKVVTHCFLSGRKGGPALTSGPS